MDTTANLADNPNITIPDTAPATAVDVLLVVDPQNDFVDPSGSLSVPGAVARIGNVNDLIDAATNAGWLVVISADWHPERTSHFNTDGGPWPPHCVAGTWGAAFYGDLDVPPSAVVVRKGTGGEDGYSAFSMTTSDGVTTDTGLAELLVAVGARRVVVAGFATEYCDKASAVDSAGAGYETSFVVDAAAAVNVAPGDGDGAIAEMVDAGVAITTTAQVLAEIAAPQTVGV